MLKEADLPPQTIGQHIKKKRLELELTQKGAAARIGVTPATVFNWENGLSQPKVDHLPAIHAFLGYNQLGARRYDSEALAPTLDRTSAGPHGRRSNG